MTLGYGTAAIGRSLSARERLRLVATAYDAGVRYFDTAPLYGAGAAEEALGRLRPQATIATKVGIVPPGLIGLALRRPATGDRFEPGDVRRQLEGSLRRLRRECIDVVLLHEVPAVGPALVETLEILRGEGRLLRWGIATNGPLTGSILAERVPEVVQLAAGEARDVRGAQLVLHSILAGRVGSAPTLLREAARAYPDAVLLVGSRSAEHIREAATAIS